MKNEITELEQLKGKTIVDTKTDCGELWVKFSDGTFSVFVIQSDCNGFGMPSQEVNLCQEGKDKTDGTLVDLGLITEQEHRIACEKEEEELNLRFAEREKERQAFLKEKELTLLKELSKKYPTGIL